MSPRRSASTSRSGGGRAAVTALVVVAAAIGMLLLVRARPTVQAFDPRSSAPAGANGVVLLLEQLGADVSITSRAPQPAANERVLVIADQLNSSQRTDLLHFVDAGGVAIVADPTSTLPGGSALDSGALAVKGPPSGSFAGSRASAADEANVSIGDCTIGSLQALRGIYTPDGLLLATSPGDGRCFGETGHSFVIARRLGRGIVIGFGDNRILTNQYLRYADNSGLVTSLLAPATGAHVRIMIGTEAKPAPQDIGKGNETLVDLVRPGVWMALSQLALAFVVFCVARGVRPGRVVREPQPTPIAGNELVLATGNLMQRAHHHARAGWLVRGEFYRQLCSYYRLPLDTSIDRLSDIVGRRSGVDPNELRAALDSEVNGGEQLLQLAARLERLRHLTISSATITENV